VASELTFWTEVEIRPRLSTLVQRGRIVPDVIRKSQLSVSANLAGTGGRTLLLNNFPISKSGTFIACDDPLVRRGVSIVMQIGRWAAVGEVACLLASMAFFAPGAWAQEVAVGEVSSVISDATGGPIAGAAVRMTATSTQLVRNTDTDNQGRYALPR
jgi:hypothetical protein